ncbi:alpha/beta hydrolase [Rhodococcus sp. LB1]|uniref:alpha/beta hydrolase n=1 Tax=Rhodococcus sp. LB1 TaxID=1807499 RepID=UPI00077A78BC|nr:alpha/beta hydrolase [Rhodococcus sp. LB1]KXX61322.1 lipase [Rhodococcus sp. LB1]
MKLDPDMSVLLDKLNDWDAAAGPQTTIEGARKRIEEMRALYFEPELLEVREVENVTIPGPAGGIPARIYRPDTEEPTRSTVLYLHGGGWVMGGLDSHESHARRVCARTGSVVVAVDYRLAPEHPFPAGYDDCLASLHWIHDTIDQLGGDASRVAVAGDSAGANLAASVALAARDAGLPLRAQLLLYVPVHLAKRYPSMDELAEGYFLRVPADEDMGAGYLEDRSLALDPRVSPIEGDLTGVAPAIVCGAECDPLRDHAPAYAAALEAAGVPVRLRISPGMLHGYWSMGVVPRANELADQLCEELAELLAPE